MMKRNNKNRWPGPQTERAPCALISTKLDATNEDKETSAASTDEDDSDSKEGDEAPALAKREDAANRHAPKITTIGPVFSPLPQRQIDGSDTRQRGCVVMDLGAGAPEMARRDPKA